MRKRLVIGGVIVVVVAMAGGAALAAALGSQTPAATYLTATASIGTVVDTVSVTGSLQPAETYALAFGQPPARNPRSSSAGPAAASSQQWTVAAVNVKAGDAVTKGTVLAAADTSDAQTALDAAQRSLDAAKARLALDSTPVTANAQARAKLAVTQANQQLSAARSAQTETAASGRLAVSQAGAVLSDAQRQLADDKAASLPDAVIAADEAAVSQAERALATARRQAASADSQAASAVETAKLNVQSAQLAYTGATTVDNAAAVAADQASVAQSELSVSSAQTTLDRLTLTAPIDGVVSSVTIEAGDVVSGTVITLRSAQLEVAAQVTETDLPAVKAGQAASVTIGALGASATGTVSEVDVASATKSASGVVSYPVTISLPDAPAGAAPSMTADVAITTATASDVVVVPVSAVGGTRGAYTVTVVDGPGAVHTVKVTVGLMTDAQAEIRSGIAAGTVVVTGTATAKDLVTTFPTGPGSSSRTAAPAASGQ